MTCPITTNPNEAIELFELAELRPKVAEAIRNSLAPEGSGSFIVYENHDLGSRLVGERIGAGFPAGEPTPPHAPDGSWGLGWRYIPILRVVRP